MRLFAHDGSDKVSLASDDETVVLRNQTGVCTVDRRNGELRVRPAGSEDQAGVCTRLGFATALATCYAGTGGPIRWSVKALAHPLDKMVAVQFHQELPQRGTWLHWIVAAGEDHFVLQVGARNLAQPVERFITLDGGACAEALAAERMLCVAYCGAHSRSPLSRSAVRPISARTKASSWWATTLFSSKKASLVLGFLTARRFVGRFDWFRGRLTAFNYGERVAVAERSVTWSEPLYLAFTSEPLVALQRYADLVARSNGGIVQGPPLFGWGSWARYHTAINEHVVLENAAELATWEGGWDERGIVHVDHGWEERLRVHRPKCTWLPRSQFFPSMRGLAETLEGKGLRLGLWVVPFAVNLPRKSERGPYGHLVRDESGAPWQMGGRGSCCCIDPTDPAGEAWLRELFRRLKGWGASYYKLDFLRILLSPEPDDPIDGLHRPRFYQGNVTRTEAYRRGLEIIRDEVGPSTYLLACGAPLLPSAGLVDGCRVGPDIESSWGDDQSGIKNCTRSMAANFFWQGRVWHNDPDFLTVPRGENLLRFRGTAVALSGGSALVSANLSRLSSRRQRFLRALRPARCEPATPVDLGLRSHPTRWQLPVTAHGEKSLLMGLFNWTDRPRSYTVTTQDLGAPVDAKDCIAWEFWRQDQIKRLGDGWTIRVGARDAALVGVKPLTHRPQLIATSAHYAMGRDEVAEMKWSPKKLSLECVFNWKLEGSDRLYFHVPDAFRLKAVSTGRPILKRRILVVRLDERGTSGLNLTFIPANFHESRSKNQARR